MSEFDPEIVLHLLTAMNRDRRVYPFAVLQGNRANDGRILRGAIAMRSGFRIADEDFGQSTISEVRDGRPVAQRVALECEIQTRASIW